MLYYQESALQLPEISNRFRINLKYAHFYRIRESLWDLATSSVDRPIRVLDLACGPGNMAIFCIDSNKIDWFGIELWPNELRQAAQTRAYQGLIQGNLVQRLPLKVQVADAVVLNEILMYLDNSGELLSEVFKVLKPSGLLYVYNPVYLTPNLLSIIKRAGRRIYPSSEAVSFDRDCNWKNASRASRINFYSFDSLASEIKKAGFQILEATGFRLFRNRIRLMKKLERFDLYRNITKKLAKRFPRLASDILVIARKPADLSLERKF
ncbi:MAG: class I SAM-dependent methyltransferase [Desulfomonilaceae bacterium]